MREEISEPQHWRANDHRSQSWASGRRSYQRTELAADAIDAALAEAATEPPVSERLVTSDIVASLASQLDLLEKQREQLQKLLDQAKGS